MPFFISTNKAICHIQTSYPISIKKCNQYSQLYFIFPCNSSSLFVVEEERELWSWVMLAQSQRQGTEWQFSIPWYRQTSLYSGKHLWPDGYIFKKTVNINLEQAHLLGTTIGGWREGKLQDYIAPKKYVKLWKYLSNKTTEILNSADPEILAMNCTFTINGCNCDIQNNCVSFMQISMAFTWKTITWSVIILFGQWLNSKSISQWQSKATNCWTSQQLDKTFLTLWNTLTGM